MDTQQELFQYLLRQGDTNLILGHRLSEMCSRAPMLEEDIALTNIALDHIGQAEALLHYAGEVEAKGRTEDDLSYLRTEKEFCNLRLVEHPNTDFAYLVARQFLIDVYQCLLYQKLQDSNNEIMAGMAKRFLKETTYHLRHSSAWVERLGQGTDESHRRMDQAFRAMWHYTSELFMPVPNESILYEVGIAPNPQDIEMEWTIQVSRVLGKAGLHIPTHTVMGDLAPHTEHLSHLLADMQYLQRTYPSAKW
jgi:ring-1,2-phenylacetyl-CoA epoxidase subunit PaaC